MFWWLTEISRLLTPEGCCSAVVTALPSLQSEVYFQNSWLWAKLKNSMAMRNVQWLVRQSNVLCNSDFGAWDSECLSAFSAGCFCWGPKLLDKSGPSEDTAGMAGEVTGPPAPSFHWANTTGSCFHRCWDTITASASVSIVFHCKDKCVHEVILCCKRLGKCGIVKAWAVSLLTCWKAILEWEEDHLLSWSFPCCLAVNPL